MATSIEMIAKLKDAEAFREAFQEGDEKRVSDGVPLIFHALSNTNIEARYAIAEELLHRGAVVEGANSDGHTALMILLGQIQHDVPRTAGITRQLLERGVDPNAQDKRGATATHFIVNLNKFTDDQLSPLYDVRFAVDGLRFDLANNAGFTAFDLARKLPYRADLVRRIEEYEAR